MSKAGGNPSKGKGNKPAAGGSAPKPDHSEGKPKEGKPKNWFLIKNTFNSILYLNLYSSIFKYMNHRLFKLPSFL